MIRSTSYDNSRPGSVFIEQYKLRFFSKITERFYAIRTPNGTVYLSCFMNTDPDS